MYEIFYNLTAEPFRLSPDHSFCYDHKGYSKARAYMTYAFMRAEGFVMVTGRPGTGKTTLIGELIENLADENVKTANLVCTQLQADDLLKVTAYSFGVEHGIVAKGELIQQLDVLLRRWHRDGRRALLIVDEAQDLSASAMEELRLLTNIQENGTPLLQIFLLGQPELRDLVLSPSMEQLHQRIVAASHLEALEKGETEAYILHRLEKVGWQGDPALSKTIFPLIYKFSEGVPRRINLICSRLFLHGCVEQRHRIGAADLREVIKELQSENLAAGIHFSPDDFQLDDQFDQPDEVATADRSSLADDLVNAVEQSASSSSTTTPEKSESAGATEQDHLHTVGNEVVVQFYTSSEKLGTENNNKNDVVALHPGSSVSGNAAHCAESKLTIHYEETSPGIATAPDIEQTALLGDSETKPALPGSHHTPTADELRPAREADAALKPESVAKNNSQPQRGNGVLAMLIIPIVTFVLLGWLMFGRNLPSIETWPDLALEWWKSSLSETTSGR